MKNGLKILLNATSTPLASIFGSGFLVIVPILPGPEREDVLAFVQSLKSDIVEA